MDGWRENPLADCRETSQLRPTFCPWILPATINLTRCLDEMPAMIAASVVDRYSVARFFTPQL